MLTRELNLPMRILMGPGPSEVHPRVLRAVATPLVGHLDPRFLEIMDDLRAMLRAVFRTANELTFAVSATRPGVHQDGPRLHESHPSDD